MFHFLQPMKAKTIENPKRFEAKSPVSRKVFVREICIRLDPPT
jgi:hypothetical protein